MFGHILLQYIFYICLVYTKLSPSHLTITIQFLPQKTSWAEENAATAGIYRSHPSSHKAAGQLSIQIMKYIYKLKAQVCRYAF